MRIRAILRRLGVSALAFACLASTASAESPSLAPETRAQIERACATCHGTDLIAQQRLTPEQWEAVVQKMVGWGALLPPGEAAPLAAGLAGAYPVDAPEARPGSISGEAALAVVLPQPDAALERDRKSVV